MDGGGPLISTDGAGRVALSGLLLHGADRPLGADHGLVDLSGVADLSMSDCVVERSGGFGARLRACGGRIERCDFRGVAAGGVFTTDATGLAIDDNRLERCGDNGVQVWRSAAGDDGTRVTGIRISDIRSISGGRARTAMAFRCSAPAA